MSINQNNEELNEILNIINNLPSSEKEYVTPQMFGAVGDNITDDSAAFQAAVDSGKTVVIPKGNYKVANINILNPVHIIGVNYPRLIFPLSQYYGYDYVPLYIFDCKGGTLEGEAGVDGVIIEGIHFDGNCTQIVEQNWEKEGWPSPEYMANRKTHNVGVSIRQRSKNVTIRDCRFDNLKDAGVGMHGGVSNITVENCVFGEEGWHGYGWNKGIVCSYTQFSGADPVEEVMTYLTIRNNRIFNCGEHGINIYTANKNCIIEGNYIKNCGLLYKNPDPNITDGLLCWGCCIKASGGTNLIISNNICINGMSNGIGLFGDTGDKEIFSLPGGNLGTIQIIGNHIIGSDHEKSRGSGIEVGGYLNAIISNNIIENVKIHDYGSAYAIRGQNGSIISNNIIKNCDQGIAINVHYETENHVDVGTTKINNNMVLADIPIRLYFIENGSISNNTCISYTNDKNGIYLHGCNYCYINDNIVNNAHLGIFFHYGSSNNIANSNIFKNVGKNYYDSGENLNNIYLDSSLPKAETISF